MVMVHNNTIKSDIRVLKQNGLRTGIPIILIAQACLASCTDGLGAGDTFFPY